MLTVDPGCDLEVERGPDWLLVRFGNPESLETDPEPLADRLWALLEQHFTYRLVLELDRLRLLNSVLIGQLIRLSRRIEEHGGVLRLCGLSPHNMQALRTCRLNDRLCAYRDRHDAIMGCARPRQPR